MENRDFRNLISKADRRLQALWERAGDGGSPEGALLSESLEELSHALEELAVAGQELEAFNLELLETRRIVEAERRRYQALFEFAPQGYLVTDPVGTVAEANQAAAELLGVPPERLVGKPLSLYFAGEHRRFLRDQILKLGQSSEALEWQTQIQPRSGNAFPAVLTAAAIRGDDRQLVGFHWLVRDVTAWERAQAELERRADALGDSNRQLAEEYEGRLRAQEALLESEASYRELFQSSLDGIVATTAEGQYLDFNQAALDIFGATADQLRASRARDWYADPADRERFAQEMERKGQVKDFEAKLRRADGSEVWVLMTSTRQLGRDGRPIYRGFLRDVTERRRAQEELERQRGQLQELAGLRSAQLRAESETRAHAQHELAETEEKHRAMVERATDGIVIIQEGVIRFANPRLAQMLGRQPQDMIGAPFLEGFAESERERVAELYRRRGQDDSPLVYEISLARLDGSPLPVEINVGTIVYEGAPAEFAFVRDVSARRAAQEELRLRARLLDCVQQAVIATDVSGVVLYWNQYAEELYGWPPDEALGRIINELISPPASQEQAEEIWRRLRAGQAWSGEYLARDRQGREFPIWVSDSPILADDGELVGVIGVSADITERRLAREKLRQSEETARALIDVPHESAFLLDTEGVVLAANAVVAARLSMTPEELVGRCIYDLLPPELAESRRARVEAAIRSGEPIRFEDERDGRIIDQSVYPIPGPEGPAERVAIYARDVTVERRAEEAQRRQARMLENVSDAVIATDPQFVLTHWNPAAERAFGWKAEEVIGRSAVELLRPEYPGEGRSAMLRALQETGAWRGQVIYRRRDGAPIPVEMVISAVRDERGRVAGHVSVNRDMSERRKAERALRVSEERFRAVFEDSKEAIVIGTPGGEYVASNPAHQALLGYSLQELRSSRAADVYRDPAERDRYVEAMSEAGFVKDFQVDLKRKDGAVLHCLVTATAYQDSEGNEFYQSITRDVSEEVHRRRELEEEVQERTEEIRVRARDQMALNRALEALLGELDEAALLEGACRSAVEDFGLAAAWVGLAGKGEEPRGDSPHGDLRLRSAAACGLPPGAEPTGIGEDGPAHRALRTRQAQVHNRASRRRLGFGSVAALPIEREDAVLGVMCFLEEERGSFPKGRVVALDSLVNAVAIALGRARLHAEVQRSAAALEARVIERTADLTDVNAELEAFAYSVAHDLRAPLRAMGGFSEALLEDHASQLDEEGRECVARIRSGATRMDALIQDLLIYSRLTRTQMRRKPVSLADAVQQALAEAGPQAAEREARIDVEPITAQVKAHLPTLVQVVANLIANALKFVPQSRTPQVRIWAQEDDRRARLWVEDNGIGIAPEHQERIFRIFERLHGMDDYPGTGIGLAIVQRGAERMKGRAGVESEAGEGSKFWVELEKA